MKRKIFENLVEIARNQCSLQHEIKLVREKCKDILGNGTNPISEPAIFIEL